MTKRILVSAGLCVALLTGCRTPDLKPFRDSTAKIQGSVVEAQDVYLDELERLTHYVSDTDRDRLEQQSKRFATNWAARVVVMEAMVKYASSLAAVADAPDRARAGLEGVAQSVKELGVLGGPYGPAIEGATELLMEFKFLADKVAAARQLKKAVLATDEDMQKLAQLLAKDFGRMRRALEENQKSIKNLMDGPISVQLAARDTIAKLVEERTQELRKKVDKDNPGWTNWNNSVGVFNQEMGEAKKYLDEADKWYLPHRAKVEFARKQMAARITLFRDTETALAHWGKAHGALAEALQKDLAPDWTLLKQSADRIEKSIKKITKEESQP